MREPYIIFQRADGAKGGKVYYVSFWDQERADYVGRRSTAMLLGELERPTAASPTSRAGARLIVETWLETHTPGRARSELAIDYLETFWADDGAYARGKAARGAQISSQYLYNNRNSIKKYVRPFLDKQPRPIHLDRITPALLEDLSLELYDMEISAATGNKVLQAIGVAMGEAYRLGLIRENPSLRVPRLAEENYVREILTRDEVKAFFSLAWSDPRLYAINFLAATTGMRLGECRGLLAEDLREGGIHLVHNWQDREGNKGPKGSRGATVKARDVPLPASTERVLRELAKQNPWNDGFVFFGDSRDRPIGKQVVEVSYKEALKEIKIDEEKRKARGLGFHAWRHWFNSQLRGKIDDHALRRLTGHASEDMTEHYTEVTKEQRAAVALLADELI